MLVEAVFFVLCIPKLDRWPGNFLFIDVAYHDCYVLDQLQDVDNISILFSICHLSYFHIV